MSTSQLRILLADDHGVMCDLAAVVAGRLAHGRAQRNGISASTYGKALASLHEAGVIARTETRDDHGNIRVIVGSTGEMVVG